MHKNSGGAVQSVDEKDRILLLRNSRQNFNLSSLNLKELSKSYLDGYYYPLVTTRCMSTSFTLSSYSSPISSFSPTRDHTSLSTPLGHSSLSALSILPCVGNFSLKLFLDKLVGIDYLFVHTTCMYQSIAVRGRKLRLVPGPTQMNNVFAGDFTRLGNAHG